MGQTKKEKKRKKAENSPGLQSNQPEQKKMATFNSPPSTQMGSQASSFNIQPNNYCIPPQYYSMGTPMSSTPVQSVTQPQLGSEDILHKILQRLDEMDIKLKSLSTIEKSVIEVKTQVSQLEEKVKQIEASRQFDSDVLTNLDQKQANMDRSLGQMKTMQEAHERKESELRDQLLHLKCREMRDNLLFYNIDEERNETNEMCQKKILEVIEGELEVRDASKEIKFHRVHRIGRSDPNKTRPIVAKFAYYPDIEKVREALPKLRLKESKYGISQQFPKEIQERRKLLVPILKEAKDQGKTAYISVDKLYIDGRLYRGPVNQARD